VKACCFSSSCGCIPASRAGWRDLRRVPDGYGSFRFLAEFAREPDSFLGLLGWV